MSFYPTHSVLLSECLNFNLFYQYNVHYTQDRKIQKLHGILNNLKFCPLYCNNNSIITLNSFNSFDKNLRFSVDTFDDGNIHFLDIKILNNGETDIYIKDTNTGLYVQYHSYEHWNTKTAWVCSLYHRTQKICSNQHLLMTQVNYLKTVVMEWIPSLHQD